MSEIELLAQKEADDAILQQKEKEEQERKRKQTEKTAAFDKKMAPFRERYREKFLDELWDFIIDNTEKKETPEPSGYGQSIHGLEVQPWVGDMVWTPPSKTEIKRFVKNNNAIRLAKFTLNPSQIQTFQKEAVRVKKEEEAKQKKIKHFQENPKAKILDDILKIAAIDSTIDDFEDEFEDALGNDIIIKDVDDDDKKEFYSQLSELKEKSLSDLIKNIEDWLEEIYYLAEPGEEYHYNALQYITKLIEKKIWDLYRKIQLTFDVHKEMFRIIGNEEHEDFFREIFEILNIPDTREDHWD